MKPIYQEEPRKSRISYLSQRGDRQENNEDFQRDAYHHLLAAILLQGVRDAADPDPLLSGPARWWLACDGLLYCQTLNLNPGALQHWLGANCPKVKLPVK